MLKKIKYFLISVIILIFVTCCHKITPSGFWTDFYKNFIVSKSSAHGPWGGKTIVSWKNVTANTFSDYEILQFANKNDWKFVDSISFSNYLNDDKLSKLNVNDYSLDILKKNVLPKLKLHDTKIFIFKTNWLNVEPGNSRETFQNGYVILNSNGTEMKMYHFWGE